MEAELARAEMLRMVLWELEYKRGVVLAKAFQIGDYLYLGAKQTDDQSGIVHLFRAQRPQYSPFGYIYLSASQGARVHLQAGSMGLHRVVLQGVKLCYGETKTQPVVQGNFIKIEPAVKSLRTSIYQYMAEHYTAPYCEPNASLLFDEPEQAAAFASAARSAFAPGTVEQ